ncbi:putative TonB-dependent receptor [Trichinella spiralis]|uniref:putative TonB-dependent receptor n=1 Tax=Trichinella spiralis TaxID=6334 RepID=UPI0001EFEC87|nr:putative TonB-dependent receptor [Trichinella spiralis]
MKTLQLSVLSYRSLFCHHSAIFSSQTTNSTFNTIQIDCTTLCGRKLISLFSNTFLPYSKIDDINTDELLPFHCRSSTQSGSKNSSWPAGSAPENPAFISILTNTSLTASV